NTRGSGHGVGRRVWYVDGIPTHDAGQVGRNRLDPPPPTSVYGMTDARFQRLEEEIAGIKAKLP
ncbi:MAG: hypothetical protein OXK17_07810, partial [Thaumarchaeota archaeon]|nr:hypothetical protein [Nitrososphaerota archaeon]